MLRQDSQTEYKFLFSGWNTRQRRHVVLAYMAPTAQQAWNTCASLNPDLQVIRWEVADNF